MALLDELVDGLPRLHVLDWYGGVRTIEPANVQSSYAASDADHRECLPVGRHRESPLHSRDRLDIRRIRDIEMHDLA